MRTFCLARVSVILLIVAGCAGPKCPQDLSRIAGWRGAAPNAAGAFRFVVVADRTGGHQEGAWEKAIGDINRLRPDFVVCVGDLVEGYKEDEPLIRSQWEEFDTITQRLDAPFFYCAGNHDVTGQIPRAVYTERHGVEGRTYYSFDYRSCHFIVLDSDAILNSNDSNRSVASAQWTWLEKGLKAARNASHVFILYHHPLYDQPQWQQMRAMLDPVKTTIFTGHQHHLSYDVEDGIPYYILASTATKSENKRETGSFLSYAHVAVDRGKPTIAIIPVGEILPSNFIDRHAADVANAMVAETQLTPVTRTGGDVALQLSGPQDGQATVVLTWSADDGWFADGLPSPETVTLSAKAGVTRSYRISPSEPHAKPPALTLEYSLDFNGQITRRTAKIPLPVIAMLDVRRISGIKIDGDMADWAGATVTAVNTLDRVTYHSDAWTGPDDCAMLVQLGYDDKALYLALDVSDESLVLKGPNAWEKDGIEIFWDPRPDDRRAARFEGPCRQLMISVPEKDGQPEVATMPPGSIRPGLVNVACARRTGGYVVELSVPFEAIGQDFRPAPGTTLYFEALVNDKDPADGKNIMSNVVLSGDDNASRRTTGYARLTFKP